MSKIAVVVPPMSNVNTTYSAAPRLTGCLRQLGHEVEQVDLNIEFFLRIYCRAGLERLFAAIDPTTVPGMFEDVYDNRERYIRVIDEAISLLQGRDVAIANRAARGDFFPEGPRFRREPPQARAARFGRSSKADLSRHLATLMVIDLVDLFTATITPHFGLLEYAPKLVGSSLTFDPLAAELTRPCNEIEKLLLEVTEEHLPADAELVCFTVPFPGMLLSALRIGQWLGDKRPGARRVLGGGFPSTELRRVEEPRLFDYLDYLVIDDGELPLQQILSRLNGQPDAPLHKTFTREAGRVVFHDRPDCASPRFRDLPAPDYTGVRLDRYVHMLHPGTNPVTRVGNEGHWLKLTAAHGCYWKKCTFCDIHLPYIGDFDPLSARELADQMDALHGQTGLSCFHFTDEAAPPRRSSSTSPWSCSVAVVPISSGATSDTIRVSRPIGAGSWRPPG